MSTKTDWDAALIAAGFTDRRSAKGGASWTALAQAVGVHTSTLTAMRDGTRDTDGATIWTSLLCKPGYVTYHPSSAAI